MSNKGFRFIICKKLKQCSSKKINTLNENGQKVLHTYWKGQIYMSKSHMKTLKNDQSSQKCKIKPEENELS